MGVVAEGVGADFRLRTAGVDDAILRDVVVVTDGFEATCLVTGFEGFHREVLVYASGTAMYHNQIDFSL